MWLPWGQEYAENFFQFIHIQFYSELTNCEEYTEKGKRTHQKKLPGKWGEVGALFREEGNVVQVMDDTFVNDLNTEGWKIQDEAFLEFL